MIQLFSGLVEKFVWCPLNCCIVAYNVNIFNSQTFGNWFGCRNSRFWTHAKTTQHERIEGDWEKKNEAGGGGLKCLDVIGLKCAQTPYICLQCHAVEVLPPRLSLIKYNNYSYLQAAALALRKVPQCNSSWTDDYIRQ